jgi:hypothetical protein
MSGGAFDYGYISVMSLAERLKERIAEEPQAFNPLVMARIVNLQRELERIGEQAKAVEYLYSGDIGVDSFNEDWVEAQEKGRT